MSTVGGPERPTGARALAVMFGALSFADQAGTAALAIHLFTVDGARALPLLATRFFPPAIAGFGVPWVFERIGVSRALWGVPLVRLLLLVGCAGALGANAPLGVIVAVLGLDMACAQAFRPAVAVALPVLSHSVEGLSWASAALANAKSVGGFAGATLGSLLGAVLGLAPTCLIVAAGIGFLLPAVGSTVGNTAIGNRRPQIQPVRAAFPALRARPTVLSLIVGSMRTLSRGAWSGLAVLLATGPIGIGKPGVALLALAAGLGGLISLPITGGLLAGKRLAPWLCGSITVAAAMTLLIADFPRPLLCVVAMGVWGLALALADLSASTVLARVVEHGRAAAVSAINENAKLVLEGVGAFGAPLLAVAIGPRAALTAFTDAALLVMVISWPAALRAEHDLSRRLSTLRLLHANPLFRQMPLDAIETLAAGGREVRCPPGHTVFSAGDPGDSYWLLQEGHVLVDPPGGTLRRLGPGEGFGEIALLHDVPRTATVTTEEEIAAVVVDRESFLLAVTGSAALLEPARVVSGDDPGRLIRFAPTVADLGPDRAQQIARAATELPLAADTVLFKVGDPADAIYVVLSGHVRVDAPGRTRTLGAGAEIGAIGVHLTGTRTATVTAIDDCLLAMIPAAEFGPESTARR